MAPVPLGVGRPIESVEHRRHPQSGIVGVALELDQCDRELGERAVGVLDRVAGVLPALVVIAVRGPRGVLLQAVPIAVAELVDPGHRRLGVRQVAPQELDVTRPLV